MAAASGVWAIDIGTNALKAMRFREGEAGIEVIGFAYVEHSRNLTGGLEQHEKDTIVAETLRKFLEENDIGKEHVAISIAGQNSFARFIKLPPVETKEIPKIVQFEAVQQIPFDINEVEWDWQMMTEDPKDTEKRIGLFAIKNELIAEVMDHFTHENLRVTCVQIAPMALYNYAFYDLKEVAESANKATIILDMGAENTTLVICTKDSVWQRSIRIGGNTFTQAIADAFRKNFVTAEKLKRTAPMSKYMRQIYTAMKPVYTDLGGEIQRSIGFYSNSPEGRDKTFSKVIALGGGMKLQGLAKYLTQTLGLPVIKPDSFDKLGVSPELSIAKFHENVSDFGVAYGLGVQLLGDAKISTNLLPRKIARAMAWTQKARMFTAAACVLLLVMLLALGTAFKSLKQYSGHKNERTQIQSLIREVQNVQSEVSNQENRKGPLEERIQKEKARFEYRNTVAKFIETLSKCLPNKQNTPDQLELFEAFALGDAKQVQAVSRKERKQIFVTQFSMNYERDLSQAALLQSQGRQNMNMYRTPGRTSREVPTTGIILRDNTLPPQAQNIPGGFIDSMGTQPTEEQAVKSGFTVLIEGYSPYGNISELLDPTGVLDNQSKWGLVTRFENLQSLFPDTEFALFNKHEIIHFRVETGLVDPADTKMPSGIGVLKEIERVPSEQANTSVSVRRPAGGGVRGEFELLEAPMINRRTPAGIGIGAGRGSEFVYTEQVLVDPLTNEEISKTYDIYTQEDIDNNPQLTEKDLGRKKLTKLGEEQFIERDHWFRIQAKFVWKNAPKASDTSASGTTMGGPLGAPRRMDEFSL